MAYLPTERDAGERRKSDSRERQGFFASKLESDKFLAIVESYGNPITESDKFFMVLVMSSGSYACPTFLGGLIA